MLPVPDLAPPALSLAELGGPACRQQGSLHVVTVPVRATAISSDGWLRHRLDGVLSMDSGNRSASLGVQGLVPATAAIAPYLGCQANALMNARIHARIDATGSLGELALELSSRCQDSIMLCRAHGLDGPSDAVGP